MSLCSERKLAIEGRWDEVKETKVKWETISPTQSGIALGSPGSDSDWSKHFYRFAISHLQTLPQGRILSVSIAFLSECSVVHQDQQRHGKIQSLISMIVRD